MSSQNFLNPAFGLAFDDLYEQEGLEKLDQKFVEFEIRRKAVGGRRKGEELLDRAVVLEDFLVELFGIEKENSELKKSHEELQKIYHVRREFVQRHVAKKIFTPHPNPLPQGERELHRAQSAPSPLVGEGWGEGYGSEILKNLSISFSDIDSLEKKLAAEIFAEKNLEILELYTAWALYSDAGRKLHKNGALFILPAKVDQQNLITKCGEKINRQGFDLTDKGYSLNRAQGEAHYCIFCHKQKKDSCRSGILDKETKKIKIDSLGVELRGCPLDEKISEMNLLKSEGFSLAAFAVATIDNPMIAGTGHRICNDCMKSCIYQKQDPVDIPQIETRVLKDVLALPYGFEIYSLLTRWNPLKEKKFPEKNSEKKILVCGLGPAGYTLAHYLLNDGHEVVAIDGLKIEPLNPEISGIDAQGNRQKFRPIKFLDEIYEPLSSRLIQGFGGVSEYGITVRWDKNYLKVIRLLLERRKNFRMFGGIRFGSSITEKIAFEQYGFDHVALCLGAGRPNIINLKNNFAKGIRAASDFLMSLQLTGAFQENLFTGLQIRMPIVVIGGGLTAVDTACEAQAYYFTQIKKFAARVEKIGKEKIFAILNEEEKIIAEEFLRDAEKKENFSKGEMLVKILYRKKIQDSPAYRLNHQELNKSLAEGIEFVENITPLEAELDEFGAIKNLKCADGKSFECKSLLIAAGTTPNISPVIEDGLDIPLEGRYFKALWAGSVITKIDESSGKAVSFFGDLNPNFEGNVVKAMASAKKGHVEITEILKLGVRRKALGVRDFNLDFLVTIEKVERLSDRVIELFVRAPLLAQQTEVGHIFRLQNYHSLAEKIEGRLMAIAGLALTVIGVDRENGILSTVVIEASGPTNLIKNFKIGESCVFMGPSGKPTEIFKNETVLLIGGGRGNMPLATFAESYKKNGCKVIFIGGYPKNSDVVRQEKIEKNSDVAIFAITNEQPNLKLNRPQDQQIHGSVIEAIKKYFLSPNAYRLSPISRIFTMGNDKMMHAIAKLRHENVIVELALAPIAVASLNSPMQCMMKGVCSQCLQKRKNAAGDNTGDNAGDNEFFYACGQQDQDMDKVDFNYLHGRCEQNSLSEKIAGMES